MQSPFTMLYYSGKTGRPSIPMTSPVVPWTADRSCYSSTAGFLKPLCRGLQKIVPSSMAAFMSVMLCLRSSLQPWYHNRVKTKQDAHSEARCSRILQEAIGSLRILGTGCARLVGFSSPPHPLLSDLIYVLFACTSRTHARTTGLCVRSLVSLIAATSNHESHRHLHRVLPYDHT